MYPGWEKHTRRCLNIFRISAKHSWKTAVVQLLGTEQESLDIQKQVKKNEIMSFTRKWTELKIIIVSKISQTQDG